VSLLVILFRAIVNALCNATQSCFASGTLLGPETAKEDKNMSKNTQKSAGQSAVSKSGTKAKRFAFPVAEIISLRNVGEPETIGMKLRWNTGQIEEVLFDSAELNGPEVRSA